MPSEENQSRDRDDLAAMPLPATLTFVLLMGFTFVVLWFGVFAMLKARW